MTHADAGREGGKTRWALHKFMVIERFAHLDRNDAIWQAYRAGHHAGRVAKYQAGGRRNGQGGAVICACGRKARKLRRRCRADGRMGKLIYFRRCVACQRMGRKLRYERKAA